MLPPLPDAAVRIAVPAAHWRGAVRASGEALAASGATAPAYTERMIGVIEEFGAYVVIAPGLALAHARPGPDVLANGLSVVTLETPVRFGHPHNDPVEVVLGLAVTSADGHLAAVAELANVFNDPSVIGSIAAAPDAASVRAILGVAP